MKPENAAKHKAGKCEICLKYKSQYIWGFGFLSFFPSFFFSLKQSADQILLPCQAFLYAEDLKFAKIGLSVWLWRVRRTEMNTVKVCYRSSLSFQSHTGWEAPARTWNGKISLNVKVIPSVNHRIYIRMFIRREYTTGPRLVISPLCWWKASQPNKAWWICMTLPGRRQDAVYDGTRMRTHTHTHAHPTSQPTLYFFPPNQLLKLV